MIEADTTDTDEHRGEDILRIAVSGTVRERLTRKLIECKAVFAMDFSKCTSVIFVSDIRDQFPKDD